MNKASDVTERHQLPKRPGELCAVNPYGRLPTSRGIARYVFVRYDVFSKCFKLYPLKSAKTKACLNKLLNHKFVDVIKPKIILSDNGGQFSSPVKLCVQCHVFAQSPKEDCKTFCPLSRIRPVTKRRL